MCESSRGWPVRLRPKLSSSLAVVGPESESHSWTLTRSVGRACGSTVASAIVNNMIELEVEEVELGGERFQMIKQCMQGSRLIHPTRCFLLY